nr:hypothetical protein CFOL_v3_28609 [Ipomoea trifida]
MGRQWSAGKLVLILGAVHWNPEAPPRTLPRVRLRCDGSFSPRSMKKGDVSLFFRRTGSETLCRGGGREKKRLRRKKLGFPMLLHAQRDAPTSGCFTPNPTRHLIKTLHNDPNTLSHLFDTNTVTIIAISSGTYWYVRIQLVMNIIRLPVDISSNSSIREANCCVKESISLHKPRGRSCATPPGRMKLACILAPETLS